MNQNTLTINDLQRMKQDGEKIAMLTCYDASFARSSKKSLTTHPALPKGWSGHFCWRTCHSAATTMK
jgi:hypothetical protein